MNAVELRRAFDDLREEGRRLAGGLTDLAQRATVYHHIFKDSGGNHVFPLIAAHGALWARGYFRFGFRLAACLSAQYLFDSARRRRQMQALNDFADAFRDINRRVCIDTYTNYHFTARFGRHALTADLIPPILLEALNRMHEANRRQRPMSDAQRRDLFEAHFLYEQEHVVGPALIEAARAFDWPVVKWLALQPIVRFAYFPAWRFARFHDFTSRAERIANGMQAFEWGREVGWSEVEGKLRAYQLLPEPFFAQPVAYFSQLREAVLAA